MSIGHKKFQPNISASNSMKLSQIPNSVLDLVIYRSLENLEATVRSNPELKIIYIVHDNSTSSCLKPIRDENRAFLTLLLLKE